MRTFIRSLFCFTISAVLYHAAITSAKAQSTSPLTSIGRDFYIAELVPSIKCGAIKPFQGFYILVSAYYDCNVTVSYFDQNSAVPGEEKFMAAQHIQAKHGLQVALDQTFMNPRDQNGNQIAGDGEQPIYAVAHIHADGPVTVQYYSTGPNSCGMYLALPTQVLGKRYVIATLPANPANGAAVSRHFACTVDSGSSEFGVIAVSDNTHLTITPTGLTRGGHVGVSAGGKHPFSVTLDRGQVYWVKSVLNDPTVDESGSVVESDQPVAVLAGNEDAIHGTTGSIGLTEDQRNMTVQQMVPVDYWASGGYVSMPFMDAPGGDSGDASAGDEYKFFTYDSTTTVLNISTNGISTPLLTQFGIASIPNVLSGLSANSNNGQRIFAEQYDYRAQYTTTEPFTAPAQMNVVPLDRWIHSCMWYVPDDKAQVHKRRYINVIANRNLLSKILLSHNGGTLVPITSYPSAGGGNTAASCTIPGHPELIGKRFELSPGAWYAKSDSAFIIYNYGMLGLDPDFDLGDNDDDDYYFEYAAPCGQSFRIDGAYKPQASEDTSCNGWTIHAWDTNPLDGGLAAIEILKDPEGVLRRKPNSDSGYISTNCSFLPRTFTIVPGMGSATVGVTVDDPLRDADAYVWVVNVAGNDTLLHMHYTAPKLQFYAIQKPGRQDAALNFTSVATGYDTCAEFVFKNLAQPGQKAFTVSSYEFSAGGQGVFTATPDKALPYALLPGDSIIFNVCFQTSQPAKVYLDTFLVHTDCPTAVGPVSGSTNVGQIMAEDWNFGPVVVGLKSCHAIKVWNTGKSPFLLTKQWLLDNNINFEFVDTALLPTIIDTGLYNAKTFTFCYTPTQDTMKDTTIMHWATDLPAPFTEQKKSFSNLYGYGITPDLQWNPKLQIFASANARTRRFYLVNRGTAPTIVDSVKLRGLDRAEFRIVASQAPLPLAFDPLDSIWVDVEFDPDTTILRDRMDTLIAYDDHQINPIALLNATIGYAAVTAKPEKKGSLRIVPDPVTSDQIRIEIPAELESGFSLEISDALGRIVIATGEAGNSAAINVASWPNGSYFVRLAREGETRTGTFRILR